MSHLLTDLTLMHKARSEVWSGSSFSDAAEYLYNNLAAFILAETGLRWGFVMGKGVLCTVGGLPMGLVVVVAVFSPVSEETDALIVPHKSFFFIASALSILLLDDLSLSDDRFPYKVNNAK